MPPVPVSVNELREIAGWIDKQRTAIASEKMVLVCGTKGPDMKEKGGDDEDDVTPAPANSDPVDDEVMHLDGYEIGSKRILAEIEEHAFDDRSEEHTSELQSLMRISYAVFCLKTN